MKKSVFGGFRFLETHSLMTGWIVLSLSVLITLFAYYISYSAMTRAVTERFRFEAGDITVAIQRRMQEQEATLWGGVGLFDAFGDVDRDQWRTFVEALKVETFLPGLQGYGFARMIAPDDLDAHIRSVRAEGFVNYAVYPAGSRDLFSAIVFLEPFSGKNLRAFGYDMWSEPVRRAAMERARDTGNAAVSGMVTLVQEARTDIQRGFLMYLPVYAQGMPVGTVAQRRAAIKGFVYSPFRINDLMVGILGAADTGIDFRIHDGLDVETGAVMYDSAGRYEASDRISPPHNLTLITPPVSIGGHTWHIAFRAGENYISLGEASQPILVAVGGIVIDMLLFLTICSLSSQRRRSLVVATEMTRELRRAKNNAERSALAEINQRRSAQKSNALLKEANEGLSRFTAVVAHDLRAPLKRVEAFVDILREDYGPDLDDDGADIIARLFRSTSRMRAMLDSLHSYSKLGTIHIKTHPARLKTVVKNSIELLGPELCGARIKVEIDKKLMVQGDANLLQNVFLNLLGNAAKFRSKRPLKIAIAATCIPDGMVAITFSDNGIGVDREHAQKIFEMFSRLHNDDEYERTGIGLAVCRKIIDDHGGQITFDPTYRDGARFQIILKRALDLTKACPGVVPVGVAA